MNKHLEILLLLIFCISLESAVKGLGLIILLILCVSFIVKKNKKDKILKNGKEESNIN